MDSGGGNSHSANHVEEAPEHCRICRAIDKAPHVPIAANPAISAFYGEFEADLFFLADLDTLRAMDVYPEYPLIISGATEKPLGSSVCVSRCADWRLWPAQVYSDG